MNRGKKSKRRSAATEAPAHWSPSPPAHWSPSPPPGTYLGPYDDPNYNSYYSNDEQTPPEYTVPPPYQPAPPPGTYIGSYNNYNQNSYYNNNNDQQTGYDYVPQSSFDYSAMFQAQQPPPPPPPPSLEYNQAVPWQQRPDGDDCPRYDPQRPTDGYNHPHQPYYGTVFSEDNANGCTVM